METIQIQDLLISKNFTWEWIEFNYKRRAKKCFIVVEFKEGAYPHQREFIFDVGSNLGKVEEADVYSMLSTLDWYDDTKEI